VKVRRPAALTRYYRAFALRGIPVFVHWTVALVLAVILALVVTGGLPVLVLAVAWLGLILVHELGHASIAWQLGYDVEAIYLSPIHGLCIVEEARTRYDACLVAWGGVSAQAALFLPAASLSLGIGESLPNALHLALGMLTYWNGITILFNLTPVPPFDGATAWGIFRARKHQRPPSRARRTRWK
jgi:Zn-dependent protease